MERAWKWGLVVAALLIAISASWRLTAQREPARVTPERHAADRTAGASANAPGLTPGVDATNRPGEGEPTPPALPSAAPVPDASSPISPVHLGAPGHPKEAASDASAGGVSALEGPTGDATYAPGGQDAAPGGGAQATETKPPAAGKARIFGKVLGKDGLPVQLVLVSIRREEDGGCLDRKPNAQGEYEAPGLAGGTYVVTCAVQGQAVLSRRLGLAEGEEKQVDFSVASGVRLFGWVSRGGRSVADVQLSFAPEHGADVTATFTRTDAQGSYEVRGVPPGAVVGRIGDHDHRIWIPEGLEELRYDIALPEGIIAGHVYGGRERAPAQAARIEVYRVGDPNADLAQHASRWVTATDADIHGRYEAKGIAGGRYTLHVTHPDYGLRVHGPVEVPDRGAAEGVDLYLGDPGRLHVTVRDRLGNPLADAVVTVRDAVSGEPIHPVQGREERATPGAFLFTGVPAGEYRVTAHAYGHAQSTQRVAVSDGMARVRFELGAEAVLEVRVKDGAGQPVEHAVLVVWDALGNPVDPMPGDWGDPSHSQSNEEGILSRGGLPSGSFRGEAASAAGRVRFDFAATEGQTTNVEVTVQPVNVEGR